jgi:hypothetical protein
MTEQDQQTIEPQKAVCHICQGEFASQEELHAHLIEAHDEETLSDDDTRPNNEDDTLLT